MREPNAVLATRIEFESGEGEGDAVVVLDGESRVRLGADDPRTPGFRAVLEQLRDQRRPVYLEVDPERGAIDRLLIPLPTRVLGIEEHGDELLLELLGSHAVHRLDLRDTGVADLVEVVRVAQRSRAGLLLTEDDSHQVIDVVAYTPAPDGPELPPFPELPLPGSRLAVPPWWRRFWDWSERFVPRRCPSGATAQSVFDELASTTCAPLTVPAGCIPFMYPDDGCWARAHEMCRLMVAKGLSPRKVWIRKGEGRMLHVDTKNSPICYVEWFWHVAPTLCVRIGPWWWPWITARMVMDPSMFTTPVTVATWKAAQNKPGASLEHTSREQYWDYGGTDPTYASTNTHLAIHRTLLLSRSQQVGPPPYANCP